VEPTTNVQTFTLYIISTYFLHKLSYYSSREKIIEVQIDSKEM
jgi:hypothetical protein